MKLSQRKQIPNGIYYFHFSCRENVWLPVDLSGILFVCFFFLSWQCHMGDKQVGEILVGHRWACFRDSNGYLPSRTPPFSILAERQDRPTLIAQFQLMQKHITKCTWSATEEREVEVTIQQEGVYQPGSWKPPHLLAVLSLPLISPCQQQSSFFILTFSSSRMRTTHQHLGNVHLPSILMSDRSQAGLTSSICSPKQASKQTQKGGKGWNERLRLNKSMNSIPELERGEAKHTQLTAMASHQEKQMFCLLNLSALGLIPGLPPIAALGQTLKDENSTGVIVLQIWAAGIIFELYSDWRFSVFQLAKLRYSGRMKKGKFKQPNKPLHLCKGQKAGQEVTNIRAMHDNFKSSHGKMYFICHCYFVL